MGVPVLRASSMRGDAVCQPAIHVKADEGSPPGRPGICLAHPDRNTLLEGQDVAEFRVVTQQVDDGAFAGAGVAKIYSTPSALSVSKSACLPVISCDIASPMVDCPKNNAGQYGLPGNSTKNCQPVIATAAVGKE